MNPAGAYIPGASLLHRLDPAVRMISFILLFASIAISSGTTGYLSSFLILLIAYRAGGIRLIPAIRSLAGFWVFFLTVFMMNAFFQPSEDPIFSWWFITFSMRGIVMGASMVMSVILLVLLSSLLTATATPVGITSGLGTLLHPLSFIGIPADEAASIVSIAITFVPVLAAESGSILMAGRARGASPGGKNLRAKAHSLVPLVLPIFLSAFRRADELSDAMEARGWSTFRRKRKVRIAIGRDEVIAFAYSAAALAAAVIIKGAEAI